ncbi:hypothetical protein KLMA_20705 [Kluyveromyces marxianus]|uniref:Uncharacterized protein n=1 Tax=Kluyveromyces marxianus (strain DMKU3-1042 / BCC 29191 / NBRC 104275) TaxID=1003335 RepID=W0T7Y1_KLUMD|nr:hypothetical protein KLMA_20705 [Kluyveromyces marxianus DMKU3-1042]BAO39163.1 hypothetical protein KLMA_20705 [Kluyveromyces marxianus DMKU3-1042]BAP70682.1 hypothetical protein KLMA_20705 [Kluyveromyces marxianus]
MLKVEELLRELINQIRLENKDDSFELSSFQNEGEIDWEKLLVHLNQIVKQDYISRRTMMIQLRSDALTIQELNLERKNLRESVKELGQIKYLFQQQILRNEKLQKQVDQYSHEFKVLQNELKEMRGMVPQKKSRRF